MATKSNFRRSRHTIKEFDGFNKDTKKCDSQNSSSGTSKALNEHKNSNSAEVVEREESNSKMLVQTSNNARSHLLLVAILEHLCSVYVPEPAKSRQVFKALHEELVSLKILSPLGGIDEMSSIRSEYKVGFARLVKAAIHDVCGDLDIPVVHFPDSRNPSLCKPTDLVRAHQRLNFLDLLGFQSRYQEEFVELGHLGRGAYGSVYSCQHKLDSCNYAVKKIAFQDMKPDLWLKVLREVKYLAGLNHKYVVRYHGAWLEYHLPAPTFATINPTNLPAIKHIKEDSHSSGSRKEAVAVEFDDESLDIVFEGDSSHGSRDHRQHVNAVDLSGGSSSGMHVPASGSTVPESNRHARTPLVLLHIQMQLCDKTLKEWISNRNYNNEKCKDVYDLIDENQNQIILKQILKGLHYIHTQNLIHRDLKPKNIFLMKTASGAIHAKVGDFGLARHIGSSDVPLTPHPGRVRPCYDEGLYTSGVGTTIYASPEQLEGSYYTSKSDMYSLGLILFELYQPFHTEMERLSSLNEARKGILPAAFCDKWPSQAKYLKLLLLADSELRPSALELLESELFLSKDQIMAKLQVNVAQQSTVIKEQRETIQELQMQLAALKVQLYQKDQLLAVKDRQLHERGQLIDALTKQL